MIGPTRRPDPDNRLNPAGLFDPDNRYGRPPLMFSDSDCANRDTNRVPKFPG